jgi:hypothetical protein
MTTKKVKISELYIDPKLTNLRHVNEAFVSRYRQAYRSGAIMPLIIVQLVKGKIRVVSGNHRTCALLKEYPPEHKIDVEVRTYKNEKEVLEDFTKENSKHGNPIDDFTKKKITKALLDEGSTPEEIAMLFGVSVKRIEHLGDGMIAVTIGNTEETKAMPVKHGFTPKEPITEVQYAEHIQKDRGFNVTQQTSQLLRWMKEDLVASTETNYINISALVEVGKVWLVANKKVVKKVKELV